MPGMIAGWRQQQSRSRSNRAAAAGGGGGDGVGEKKKMRDETTVVEYLVGTKNLRHVDILILTRCASSAGGETGWGQPRQTEETADKAAGKNVHDDTNPCTFHVRK